VNENFQQSRERYKKKSYLFLKRTGCLYLGFVVLTKELLKHLKLAINTGNP
jgi:hypothetical protein